MTDVLRFVPGQFWQAYEEQIPYTVNVANWSSAPGAACFTIWNGTSNVGASNLQSAASAGPTISGANITTPCIISTCAGVDYRCELKFSQSGNVYEGYFYVTGKT